MKKRNIFFGGIISIFFVCANALAGFSYSSEKAKCQKIKDRTERSECYAAAYLQRQIERSGANPVQEITGKNQALACQLKVGTAAQKACEREAEKKMEEERKEIEKKTNPQKEENVQADTSTSKKKEIFLKVVPCEKKKTRIEKIVCYNEFHKEQEEKKKQAAEKEKEEAKAFVSPTLQRMKCTKIRERDERNQCYIDLKKTEKEKKYDAREEAKNNFEERSSHAKCLEMSNASTRAKCFHELEKIERQIADEQEKERNKR